MLHASIILSNMHATRKSSNRRVRFATPTYEHKNKKHTKPIYGEIAKQLGSLALELRKLQALLEDCSEDEDNFYSCDEGDFSEEDDTVVCPLPPFLQPV